MINSIVHSSLTKESFFYSIPEFFHWFQSQKKEFSVKLIHFDDMDNWLFEAETMNIIHTSGKFFSIEGVRVKTNHLTWSQPIINQPEIGILGIITAKVEGIQYFLMQVKIEPGNVNLCQLSPTLQATKSNYTRVHG